MQAAPCSLELGLHAASVGSCLVPGMCSLSLLRWFINNGAVACVYFKPHIFYSNKLMCATAAAARYLGGVLDFTGELNRHAVACATRRDVAAVSRCREIVDALMGQFLQFGEQRGLQKQRINKQSETFHENCLLKLLKSSLGGIFS